MDWGHLGSLEVDGVDRQLWGFTFTLGHSRMMMAAAALNQKLGTLLRMHETAFDELGGVPMEILYDRMRTVWQEIDGRGEVVWNPVFLDFTRYCGFTPRLCRPYRAQTKGKVESGVMYVRQTSCADCWVGSRVVWMTSTPSYDSGSGRWPTSGCMGPRTNW